MSFTSLFFLFVFLPVALFVYYAANEKARDYVLVVFSLFFYAFCSAHYLFLFLFSAALTVVTGRVLNRTQGKRLRVFWLVFGILANLGILFYYKYAGFTLSTLSRIFPVSLQIGQLALPAGISFYTFKAVSYLADVYSGNADLSGNGMIKDMLYLTVFTQLPQGPLSRYRDFCGESKPFFDTALFSGGVYRFMIGFNKKVILANILANITDEVYATPVSNCATGFVWLGSVCYSLQLLFDFAGYSDMAVGLSEMFGLRCMENFRYPYMTESVSKFWRRWHISLGAWFRDYVYIPMGGSRTKKWRIYFNLFVVWALTGIWHGAAWNFIAWGLGYFVAIAFERATGLPDRLKSKAGRIIYRILALLFINFQWVLFRAPSIRTGLGMIKRMLIPSGDPVTARRALILLSDNAAIILIALLLCFPVVPRLHEKCTGRGQTVLRIAETVLVFAVFLWAVSFVVAGNNNPFAYANF
ncbi:MAG: MBOAT family protein [Lachnospiraceae bacterium]|nr:MBOAT family protein [Lachnospiraceae bacterium]